MTSAITIIIIVALLAYIAQILGRRKLAVVLVMLIGALLINTPGTPGEYARIVAKFTLNIPSKIASVVA